MEFDKTRELPRPGEIPKDFALGGLTLLGFLFCSGVLTMINPIFLEATMAKVYLLLIAILALAVGLSGRTWWLVAVGVLTGVPLMLAPFPWTLVNQPILLIGWIVLALVAAGVVTTNPDRLNVFLAVGFLAFAASALWQTSHFAAPKLVIYNGLNKPVVVKAPEPVEVAPLSFASTDRPVELDGITQLKDGSVVEKINLPPSSFLEGSLLYNVKGRGQLVIPSTSEGFTLEKDLAPRIIKMGPRGVEVRFPGSPERTGAHWVEVKVQP